MTTESLSAAAPRPAGGRPRNFMLLLIAGIIAAYVATNGVMLMFAIQAPPVLVSQTYYEDSRTVGAEQAARRASEAAGWEIAAQPIARGEVAIELRDRGGRPASGFAGEVSAYRPNDAALDQELTWREDAAKPGRYTARFARPKSGQWQLRLNLRRGGERVTHELRITTP